MKTTAILLAALLLAVTARAGASDKSLPAAAYQASVAQEQLRKQTKKLREDLRALLMEYQSNQAAGTELAQGQAILDRLDQLSDKEMMDVVQALRDASKSSDAGQANTRLATAGTGQKGISTALRVLADRLTTQKDESSVRQRLKQLAIRQALARYQAALMGARYMEQALVDLNIAEQVAISNDIASSMEVLARLSSVKDASAPAFAAALAVGSSGGLVEKAAAAANETTAKRFAAAAGPQGEVIEVLLQMLDKLNALRPSAERVKEAATRMKELSSIQNQLADSTHKSYVGAQAEIARSQSAITAEVLISEREIRQLNAAAGDQTIKARGSAETVDQMLEANRVVIDKPEGKKGVVDSQKVAVVEIAKISELLREQLKKMGGSGGAGQSASQGAGAMDPKFAALQNAAASVMRAKTQLDRAASANMGGQRSETQSNLNNAAGELANAQSAAEQGGSGSETPVGENLSGAQTDVQQGKEQQQGGNQMMTGHEINEALQKADAALAGIQAEANKLAGAQGAPPPGHGDGMEPGKGGAGPLNGGTGNPNGGGALLTEVSATAGISERDREALSMLQREKPPVEYNEMVRQYRKNLSDGTMPGL